MKWNKSAAFAMLLFGFVASVEGDERVPWIFRNIAVIELPRMRVEVERTVDLRGVEMKFDEWAPETEEAIKTALVESSLLYRLHPLKGATMSVEIYSSTTDVDFAIRTQNKSTQIIVGEVRQERVTADLLKLHGGAPIEAVANLVRSGEITVAEELLSKQENEKSSDFAFLPLTRFALIDYIRYGRTGHACPALPLTIPEGADGSEALILNAWCHRERGETDTALKYVKLVEGIHPDKGRLTRMKDLEKIIIAGRILGADRSNPHVRAAAEVLRRMDFIASSLKETSFIQSVSDILIAVGLGEPTAQLIHQVVSSGKGDRPEDFDAVLIDAYLAAGRYVLAQSAATYFLSRRPPAWRAVRLHRGLGHAVLQGGDWTSAAVHLQQAKTRSVEWRLEDELALIEAELRSNSAIAPLETRVNDLIKSRRAQSEGEKGWLARLAAEVALRAGRMPEDGARTELPAYVIYQAAEAARKRADLSLEEKLLTRVAQGSSGWSKLAKAEQELAAMQRELETMRKTLEVEP